LDLVSSKPRINLPLVAPGAFFYNKNVRDNLGVYFFGVKLFIYKYIAQYIHTSDGPKREPPNDITATTSTTSRRMAAHLVV